MCVKPARRHGRGATLQQAAELIADEAEILKRSSTVGGRWPSDRESRATKAEYERWMDIARNLLKAARYFSPNPLGGPAKMFDAIADCIRAGDPVEDVLRDYGLQYIRKPTTRRNPHGTHRRHP